jgi:hypothetical protein
MQRLNRSAHAPVGAALFLFLGLAILPISLGVAGVQVSFSPRLSAAMDAWQQIAEVFGASYQPGTASDLSVVNASESDPSNPIDSSTSPSTESACAREPEALTTTLNDVRDPGALKACARRASPRVESLRSLAAKRVASVVVASFENQARVIGVLGAMKLETVTREEMLKSIERQVLKPSFEAIAEIRNLPIPISKSMRVLVRMKRAAAASSAKTAECKVFSALASARRHECERAMLTSMPGTSPDNSEF